MYMSISKKIFVNEFGHFEKPFILIVFSSRIAREIPCS
jgi:hypothetical protein